MSKVDKTFKKGISLALALAMAAGPAMPYVQAGANVRADEAPTPVFYFDMESLENGKVINTATGKEYALGGNAGELVNSVGTNGKALKLDGTNYVDLGTEFQPTNAYTLTGWVKQDAGSAGAQAIFARGYSGKVPDHLTMKVKDGQVIHEIATGASNGDWGNISTQAVIDPAEWEHIAVTRDHNNLVVYVNGEKVAEKTSFTSNDIAASDKHMYVGMDCNGNGNLWSDHAFKGVLDELRLYDEALTEDQIKELAYVEAAYSVTEFSNGKVEVKLADYVTETPAQDDFKLKFFVDDKEVTKEVTAYEYRESDKTAVFTFDAFENMTSAEKSVKVRVEYKGVAQESEFVLAAGDNQAPTVTDIRIQNRSTEMLGEEPHVKGMLQAEYTFADAENDVEGETKYQWYISDTPDGEYTPLQGIRTKSILLLHQYVGKYLKCEITPADVNGNIGESVMSPATTQAVMDTEGNPLTDWFYEAKFGLSHHFLSNYFNLPHVYTSPEEMWDRKSMTWDEFVGQFDAEAYAEQINEIGARFVIITLGQNSGSYCAPNPVYDKYMREAGLIKEGEANPKTTSMENDLPMKMANALEKYGIKVMLYLPSNPPHSACWDETGDPNGYGYFTDYLVTKNVFDYTPGYDGNPSQKARKVLSEMVTWWSEHYGDKIAGWWFDGFYHSGAGSQFDMSLEYNIATLANAAKAGNPYNIVAFNKGINNFQKMTDYTDYTAGECTGLDAYPNSGRWTNNFYNQTSESERKADCQNFMFGPLGSRASWSNGWGCSGINHTDVSEVTNAVDTAMSRDCVIGLDTRVNVHGQIDKAQYEQLKEVKKTVLVSVREKLAQTIEKAKALTESDYTPVEWAAFQKEIAKAQVVLDKDNTTDEEMEQARRQLIAAMGNLGSDTSRDLPVDGMTATAGSEENEQGSDYASNVLDGNSNTMWHTDWDGVELKDMWIDITLPEPTTVGGVRIQSRTGSTENGVIDTAEIWVKTADSEEYVKVVDEGVFGKGWNKVTFDEIENVTNVKIQPTSTRNNNTFASAAEIRIMGGVQAPVESVVDKTALQAAVDVAKALNKDEYTAESWAVLETKLAAAEAALAKEDATDYDVLLAEANLKNALELLATVDGVERYTVTVENGTGAGKFAYNTEVTVTAETEKDGMKFAGWEVDGKIISKDAEYTFYVSNDITLKAVYAEEAVEQTAEALVTNVMTTKRTDGKYDVKFVGQLVLPEGYTLKEAGLVWSSKEATELVLGGSLKPTYVTKISETNQFSVTIKGMPAGRFLRGRIFATVEKDGVEETIYSAENRAVAK